jgi:predicted enzyme related to lactoylglutathione lyase
MKIKEIAFTVLPVSDVKRSRDFYISTFGLKETANWEDKWVEFDIGPGTLAISTGDGQMTPGAKGAMVALEVEDLTACLREMEAKGVNPAGGPFDSPVCAGAMVADPDGNQLMLHQRKQKS